MEEKFQKNRAKKKNFKKLVIIVLCVVILLVGVFLLWIGLKNIIEVSRVNDDAKFVSDQVAKNASPILVNNLLLGAVSGKQWVSSEKFYFLGDLTLNRKVDVYTKKGKKGTYELEDLKKDAQSSAIYLFTSNFNRNDEYIAVESSGYNCMPQPAVEKETITEEDEQFVKKVMGRYRLLNPSMEIKEAYHISLNQQNSGTIYVINNQVGKFLGGYSAVIYQDFSGKGSLVKYSFVANLKDSSKWPIYSFKFVVDFNQDGTNELVIQETKESEVKYDIMEFRDGKFVEVLSSEIKIE